MQEAAAVVVAQDPDSQLVAQVAQVAAAQVVRLAHLDRQATAAPTQAEVVAVSAGLADQALDYLVPEALAL
jgi:hypothetical protein